MTKAILFDLGGTLVYDEGGKELVKKAYENVAKYLRVVGYDVTVNELVRTYLEVYDELKERSIDEFAELDMLYIYWKALKRLGVVPTLPLVRGCIEAYYIVRASRVKFFPEVKSVLKRLKGLGLKMAVVSNANIGFDYVIESLNLKEYFDVLIASYRVTRKKPHPLIFAKALEFLGVRSKEAIMVGDSLGTDILGAKKFGLKAIWIVRKDVDVNSIIKKLEIKPDAVIRSLDQLFAFLD